jgi:hypothetical protein
MKKLTAKDSQDAKKRKKKGSCPQSLALLVPWRFNIPGPLPKIYASGNIAGE